MKVLLLSLPMLKEHNLTKHLYPLGIGYLAASLKGSHDVSSHYYSSQKCAREELGERFASFRPDVVGITCVSHNRGFVGETIRRLKGIDDRVKVVVGGVHASFCYEQMLNRYGADVVVMGEGERIMCELCSALERATPLGSVRGIAYVEDGEVVCTPPAEVVEDLDDLPAADHSYARSLIEESGMGILIGSRGCPQRCHFCSTSSFWGQSVRMNSVPRVVDDMEALISRFNAKKIFFFDDTFNLGVSRVKAISREILRRGLEVEWGCQCRVTPVSEEMIGAMVEAGCRHIGWGLESGSKDILDRMDKKTSVSQIRKAFEVSAKFSDVLSTCALVMVGNPGETARTVRETLDLLNSLPMTDTPYTNIVTIFPGTLLYESMITGGHMSREDWQRYDTVPSYTLENSFQTLSKWAKMISRSGNRVPFDHQKHFFFGSRRETARPGTYAGIIAATKRLMGVVTDPARFMHGVRMHLPAGRIRF